MFRKGQIAWNKGTKGLIKPNSGSFKKGMAKSPMAGMKKGQKRGPQPEWHKLKNRLGHLGRRHLTETRRKMSEAHRKRVEEGKNNLWKGGISKINRSERLNIMATVEYKIWRSSVFERDDYTCRFCGQRGVTLHADHIKPFALYPELRFAIDNGRTLCQDCHRKTDTWGRPRLKELKD